MPGQALTKYNVTNDHPSRTLEYRIQEVTNGIKDAIQKGDNAKIRAVGEIMQGFEQGKLGESHADMVNRLHAVLYEKQSAPSSGIMCSQLTLTAHAVDYSVKNQATFILPGCDNNPSTKVTVTKNGSVEEGASMKVGDGSPVQLTGVKEGKYMFGLDGVQTLADQVGKDTVLKAGTARVAILLREVYDQLDLGDRQVNANRSGGPKSPLDLQLPPKVNS